MFFFISVKSANYSDLFTGLRIIVGINKRFRHFKLQPLGTAGGGVLRDASEQPCPVILLRGEKAFSSFFRRTIMSRMMIKDGITTAIVAINAPGKPACELPTQVARLTMIGPGVLSLTAII